MSYILDALQRADAQRERGNVPGLNARPITSMVAPARSGAHRRLWLAIMASVVLLAALAGGLWFWRGTGTVAPATPMPVTPPAATAVVSTAAIPVPAPLLLPPIAPRATETVALRAPVASAPLANAPVPPKPRSKSAQFEPPPLAKAAPALTPAPPMAPLLGELPEDIRRQIPALAISGTVYSDNPAQRLLLVNGQVLTQGSSVAPEVTLVEIRKTNSEFTFRGTHFRVAH